MWELLIDAASVVVLVVLHGIYYKEELYGSADDSQA
jgi:hypothetical protein